MKDYVQIAIGYAKDKNHKCEAVKLACKRFLTELSIPPENCKFDSLTAQQACEFIESHRHYKGHLAAENANFNLEPWQVFYFVNVFGWYEKHSKTLRFKLIALKGGRKNGFTAMAHLLASTAIKFGMANRVSAESTSNYHFELKQRECNRLIKNRMVTLYKPTSRPGDINLVDEIFDPLSNLRNGCINVCFYSHDVDAHYTNHLESGLISELKSNRLTSDVFILVYENERNDALANHADLVKGNPNAGVSINFEFLRDRATKNMPIRMLASYFGIKPFLDKPFRHE